ncbi:hypothetical protein NIIDMKKI_74880 [Mycobacterium kansasii]|uniref:Short chain dehydrogenase family protein n=1 Tax=Mycobacterium kansasii TaxID=1768 RepID=A0A7G1IMS1_MYCKA|nr:hypothetical protein NIIDMKKI_74570 [Mycobacterium kansasii]BCI92282.1 hypothetical protein NIIDMKKI_74880 [Mycobacterium kansasii]
MAVHRDVLTVIGVGGIGEAIARRSGSGKTVLLADNNDTTLASVVESLSAAGHQVLGHSVDVASAESVRGLAQYAASWAMSHRWRIPPGSPRRKLRRKQSWLSTCSALR